MKYIIFLLLLVGCYSNNSKPINCHELWQGNTYQRYANHQNGLNKDWWEAGGLCGTLMNNFPSQKSNSYYVHVMSQDAVYDFSTLKDAITYLNKWCPVNNLY
jgi:hypothetical protein